jgi:hypothetical protein
MEGCSLQIQRSPGSRRDVAIVFSTREGGQEDVRAFGGSDIL